MEVLGRVKELVKPQYDKLECWIHSWMHIEDVVKYAEKLAELEEVDVVLCVIAAYCHDLGRMEEEKRKREGKSFVPHALLSIEPTVRVLQKVGISGVDFAKVVEAVAVHSYRVYEGDNEVAQILQDADKLVGLGPRGFLDLVKCFAGKDYVNPDEIIKNKDNKTKLREFDGYLLNQIEEGPILDGIMKGLKIKIEYMDMFHVEHSCLIGKEGWEHLKEVRDFLKRKFD